MHHIKKIVPDKKHTDVMGGQHFGALPDEIILQIFPHLDGATFVRCMRVCHQWKNLIEYLEEQNFKNLWKKFTLREFPYQTDTMGVCQNTMNKRQIYVTLYLWSQLKHAAFDSISVKSHQDTPLHAFALCDGVIHLLSSHCKQSLNSCDFSNLGVNWGSYCDLHYSKDLYAILDSNGDLFVNSSDCTFGSVEAFALAPDCIYVRSMDKVVLRIHHQCNLIQPIFDSQWGSVGKLYVSEGRMFTRNDQNECVSVCGNDKIMKCNTYSQSEIAGCLGTYAPYYTEHQTMTNERRLGFLKRAFGSKSFHRFEKITAAIVYNNLLIVGYSAQQDTSVSLYEMSGTNLSLMRTLVIPDCMNGRILGIKFYQCWEFWDVILLMKKCLKILRISRYSLINSKKSPELVIL